MVGGRAGSQAVGDPMGSPPTDHDPSDAADRRLYDAAATHSWDRRKDPTVPEDQYARQDPQDQFSSSEELQSSEIPHPGTTAQMDDQPDHGEDSYRGSGRLTGKRAVITGGDSGIGRAVAIAFAREGADVLIAYLPEEEEDARTTAQLVEKAGRK